MSTTKLPGFCLGCGRDVGLVEVPTGYAPTPSVAHPSWCRREACLEARRKFREVTRPILGY